MILIKIRNNIKVTLQCFYYKKGAELTCSSGVEKKLMREITPANRVQSLTIYFTLTFPLIKTNWFPSNFGKINKNN